jgi:hypothetical protein
LIRGLSIPFRSLRPTRNWIPALGAKIRFFTNMSSQFSCVKLKVTRIIFGKPLMHSGARSSQTTYSLDRIEFNIHVYAYSRLSEQIDYDSKDETTRTAVHISLPTLDLDGVWESLIYENDLQYKLLKYIQTAFNFAGTYHSLLA